MSVRVRPPAPSRFFFSVLLVLIVIYRTKVLHPFLTEQGFAFRVGFGKSICFSFCQTALSIS